MESVNGRISGVSSLVSVVHPLMQKCICFLWVCVNVHVCAPCARIACSWLCAKATVEIPGDTVVWHCRLQWRLLIWEWPFHRREGMFVWIISCCVVSLSLQRLQSIKHHQPLPLLVAGIASSNCFYFYKSAHPADRNAQIYLKKNNSLDLHFLLYF